ncbi:MAG: glycosyl hydrolase family 65 protein, partial [Clostridium paraputrificum]
YYEKITTHDSSLSRSIFGMMASEIGEKEKAYNYFMDTALMDLIDMQQNTKDGIHAANMGGTWMSIVYGFAGIKVNYGILNINPRLPEKWSKVSFKITFKNKLIKITITELDTIYELIEGSEEAIVHCGQEVTIKTNEIVKIENKVELE